MGSNGPARTREATVSQTVGPFFHLGLKGLFSARVAEPGAHGRHIALRGRVVDGDGQPVPDALIEVWQADANGKYPHPADEQDQPVTAGFKGFARVPTNDEGGFLLATIKPGRVPAPGGGRQAPHLLVALFMRGLLRQLATRVYFADEACNEEDLLLQRVPASRRGTLLAKPIPEDPDTFEWNIVLQGSDETVFFDY